jgi:hypothetical protein
MKLKFLEKLENYQIKKPIEFNYHGTLIKFTGHIRLVKTDELQQLTITGASDAQTVRELLLGWEGFQDDGQDVPFSSETLNELLEYGGIAGRLAIEVVNAQYEVREKN